MDYKEAYYNLIGQIDDVICALEDKYQPVITAIEELKKALLKSEENIVESSE